MKNKSSNRIAGVTLIEILTVVAIIAILAGILLPVLAKQKINAKAKLARLDCSTIAQAITQYNMDNIGRFPIAGNLGRYVNGRQRRVGGVEVDVPDGDITFSGENTTLEAQHYKERPPNADLMIILSALESLDGNDVNEGHARNSKKFNYLGAKMTDSKGSPGMGPDGVYRDPFGNPYVVTIDKNGDGKCHDKLYGTAKVSAGAGGEIGTNGLMKEDSLPGVGLGYVLLGKAMVWSFGPDHEWSYDVDAKIDQNRDNIIGW